MNAKDFVCQHLELEEDITKSRCTLTRYACLGHCGCLSTATDCLYYKIYEEGYNNGYSEGKLGEDW